MRHNASPVCTLCLKSGYDEDRGKSLIPPLPTWVIKYNDSTFRLFQITTELFDNCAGPSSRASSKTFARNTSPRSHKSLAKSLKARRQNEARTVCEQGPVCRSQRCAHSRSSPSQSSMTSTCRRPAVTGVTQWNLCETKTSALRR